MRLVDANILVYAFTTSFPQHERARAWRDERLSDTVPLGLPSPSLRAFAALALEHGLAVASADTDSSRFPKVRLENPLA